VYSLAARVNGKKKKSGNSKRSGFYLHINNNSVLRARGTWKSGAS